MASKDYYELLGVSRNASDEEIKRAFRKQAQKHHPDAGGNEDTFKEINEAYEVLSDPKKKAMYDQFGTVGGGAAGGNPYAGGNPFGGGNPFAGAAANINWGDIFGNIRNGDGAFGSDWDFRVNRGRQGKDLQASIDLTFEEAFNGVSKRVTIRIPSTGESQEVTAKIPAGAMEGGKLRIKGKGDFGPNNGPRGDLLLVTHISPHPYYERDKEDVNMELPISVSEAAFGASVVIPTPDGSLVKLRIPSGSESGKTLRVRGKGAKKLKGKGYGDLYVKLKISLPKHLNAKQKQALEAFEAASAGTDGLRSQVEDAVDKIKAKA